MGTRKKYKPEDKVKILREYLEGKTSTSEICEKYSIHPNQLYKWKNDLFQGALQTFSGQHRDRLNKEEVKIKVLEGKLNYRDSVISKLASENIELKKTYLAIHRL